MRQSGHELGVEVGSIVQMETTALQCVIFLVINNSSLREAEVR